MTQDENPTPSRPAGQIHVAASIIERSDGMIALVRKRGTTAFMQPGGKLEPGETAEAAVLREVEEELGIRLAQVPQSLGRFSAPAANEADTVVVADVFWSPCDVTPSIQAEIAELRWIDPNAPGDVQLAPLTRDHIIPALLARRGSR